ncbi:hypothetical protein [Desulfosediminicola ganghwensis]|uniref:hypothetical protein n=1 Tax=Desulfosediminicola ganghwensis TaxID=2569540 RepID=UPI0010AC22FC|nr:hypothetical protein [Desulfosediminicola ganghwensis]
MQIHEWEIWHTYSTYIQSQSIDLEAAACKLVEAEFVELAMLQNGQTFWKSQDGFCRGYTDVNHEPYGSQGEIKLIKFPEDISGPSGFAFEAWYQAAHLRFNELRVIGGESDTLPHPYLRAFLGQINLIYSEENGGKVICYPILNIYETGIITLSFRTISPQSTTKIENLISGAVNLFKHSFEKVEVPRSFSKHATRASYDSLGPWNIFKRLEHYFLQKKHEEAVDFLATTYDEGDFQFVLSPLSSSEEVSTKDRLQNVALSIFLTATHIISNPRYGIRKILFGQRHIPHVASYWTGRPHIHITNFSNQKKTASENEKHHGYHWGSILARTNIADKKVALNYLEKDLRPFEDYSIYINLSASLWVWSKNGVLQQKEHADPNNGTSNL